MRLDNHCSENIDNIQAEHDAVIEFTSGAYVQRSRLSNRDMVMVSMYILLVPCFGIGNIRK